MSNLTPTIPKGSWVLITGATGFVGVHVAKQFLERGYRVRGTVRDLSKASWLVDTLFKAYADRGDFELARVPDISADHAFDNAVRGVTAIAHVATIFTLSPDPNEVIPQTVAGTVSMLEAALKEPSVQEFVYTGSVVAATFPVPGNSTHVERDTYNEAALQLAWAPPPYEPTRSFPVYAASKAAAEKALWKFVQEKQPHFTVNVVSPSMINGEPLSNSHIDSNTAYVKKLYDGDISSISGLGAIMSIDVTDVALLHVAAVLDPELKDARLQAWGHPTNWNKVLAIMRKLCPQHKFIGDLPDQTQMSLSTDERQSLALVKKWAHQDGWKTLEETVANSMRPFMQTDFQA